MSPRRCRHARRLVLAARRSDRVVYPELVDSVLAMRIVAAAVEVEHDLDDFLLIFADGVDELL